MITLSEVKNFLGIEGTEKDNSITALTPVAESVVLEMLKIDSFLERAISNERVEVKNTRRFFLKQFPIKEGTIDISNGSQTDETFFQDRGAVREVRIGAVGDEKILFTGEYIANYTAGWEDEDAVPSEIKHAISLVISGFLAEQDSKGGMIESYTIYDVEQVKFRSSADFQTVKLLLKKYK